MLISWLVFPLLLCALALGCGLLLQRVSGMRLPGALLLPTGLAVIVVIGLFPIMSDSTAELTTPVVIALAVTGLVLSPPWKRLPLDRWALACGVAVFAVYAAPVVLSGEATFASYLPMVDGASWFGLTDHIMDHGRNIASLPESDYKGSPLEITLPGGYPLGSFLALGAGSKLLSQDPAWLFQPYLAFVSAMLALSLYGLGTRLFPSPRLRALVVFIASQPAVLYGAVLWSGIKELSAAWVLALLAALIFPLVQEGRSGRKLLPVSVASAATLGLLSFAGAIWLLPLLAGVLVLSIQLHGRAVALAQAMTVLVATSLLSIPTLSQLGAWLPNVTADVITGGDEVLLFHPLSWRQLLGIWPAGDFRSTAGHIGLTNVLVGVTVIAAVLGLVWAWRSRRWELVIYAGGLGCSCLLVAVLGSPWVDAKALEITSPAILLLALAGILALPFHGNGGRPRSSRSVLVAGQLAGALIAAGVLWSNALAYHDVTLAPRSQLRELERIGEQFAGQGPTLLTDYEPYAARHFLRDLEVRGTWPFRIPLGGGRSFLPNKDDLRIDTEAFDKPSLLHYRTIVRRHNPVSSYPASAYRLAWSGRYWEVWQRIPRPGRIVAHLALGGGGQPVGKPRCKDVRTIAREVGASGVLAFSERPSLSEAQLVPAPVWTSHTKGAAVPSKLRSGVVKGSFDVPSTGRYGFWTSGIFYRRVQLWIDGKAVSKPRREWNFSYPNYVLLGGSMLSSGRHSLELHYGDEGSLHPGTGGHAAVAPGLGVAPLVQFGFGPLVLSRDRPSWRVGYVRPSQAHRLCGRTLDWVEGIGVTP